MCMYTDVRVCVRLRTCVCVYGYARVCVCVFGYARVQLLSTCVCLRTCVQEYTKQEGLFVTSSPY